MSNTKLFTPRASLFRRKAPLFSHRGPLFRPGYVARPLLTQAGLKLTTQDGRAITIQGLPTS